MQPVGTAAHTHKKKLQHTATQRTKRCKGVHKESQADSDAQNLWALQHTATQRKTRCKGALRKARRTRMQRTDGHCNTL